MWQETEMFFLNPQHRGPCDGVNASFHFLGKKGCLAARLRSRYQLRLARFSLIHLFVFFFLMAGIDLVADSVLLH